MTLFFCPVLFLCNKIGKLATTEIGILISGIITGIVTYNVLQDISIPYRVFFCYETIDIMAHILYNHINPIEII